MSRANLDTVLRYYRHRRGVLFLSYCRFWEKHGFVQQSLAYTLVRNGVDVVWLDGAGWRSYVPVVETHPKLHVAQLPILPMQRVPWIRQFDLKRQKLLIEKQIAKLGGNPVIWVQGGLDESLAERLPYVDVFSVFDDPYRHTAAGALCRKARVIVCQNTTASKFLAEHASKVHTLLPPMEFTANETEAKAEVFFPDGFPPEVMGYVGSFFYEGFDFELFEKFIQEYPQWGFVLMGRTDAKGMEVLESWKKYTNFHYFPWVPRNQVASVWKKLRLAVLFYRANRTQDGAFPVKTVEALRYGVPVLATQVTKTIDLAPYFPVGADFESLRHGMESALEMPPQTLSQLYEEFSSKMNPGFHLASVAQWLQT